MPKRKLSNDNDESNIQQSKKIKSVTEVNNNSKLAEKAKSLKNSLAAKLAKIKKAKAAAAAALSATSSTTTTTTTTTTSTTNKSLQDSNNNNNNNNKATKKKINPYLAHRHDNDNNNNNNKRNKYNKYDKTNMNNDGNNDNNNMKKQNSSFFVPSRLTRRKEVLFVAERKALEKLERRRFVPNVDDDDKEEEEDKQWMKDNNGVNKDNNNTMMMTIDKDDDDTTRNIKSYPKLKIRSENFLNDITISTLIPEWWDCDYLSKDNRRLAKQYWNEWREKTDQGDGPNHDITNVKLIQSTFKTSATLKRNVKSVNETKYVEHPKTYDVVGEELDPGPQKLILTDKERRRIRKRAREERRKDEQIKIQMGLIPPPEPKVKLSNLARVLGEQAVADPSKIEKYVKEQMAERLNKHNMSNLARKLTPAERREKRANKLKEDTSIAVHTAIYCVKGSILKESPQTRFKINVNSKQYNLTGVCLMGVEDKTSLIILEGGEKGLKKLNKLLLRRIKWNDIVTSDGGGGGSSSSSSSSTPCTLLWEGVIPKRLYKDFRLEECTTLTRVRQRMRDRGGEHYLDMCINSRDG